MTMDFKRLKQLVDKKVVLDINNASEHELRFNYNPGNDNLWHNIIPEKYRSEEQLANIINSGLKSLFKEKLR